MTLDEAIRIEEETARRSENHLEYNRSHKGHEYEIAAGDCEQSMIYHRQLAEWLRDYKRLKEQEPIEVESAKLQNAYNKGFEDCRKAVFDMVEDMTDQFGVRHRVITEGMISLLPSVNSIKQKKDPWIGDKPHAKDGFVVNCCSKY